MKKVPKDKLSIAMFGQKNCDRSGGVEVVVTELSARMAALGHDVTCYNRSVYHAGDKEIDGKRVTKYKGVHEKYVPTINRKGLAAVTSSFFAALACAFGKYDIVHIHAEGPAAMCWLPKLFGKRVIVTVHGLDWQREKWNNGFGSKYIHFGERCATKYADEIIVLSESMKKYFKDTYKRETQFIPNGVNKPILAKPKLIKEKYGLTSSSYVLALFRMVPEKRADLLIKAFMKVNTDKKLIVAGGSSDTQDYLDKLKKMASSDNRIIFTGYVQGRLLEELYSNAYIYILPSDLEGMPLSLLEAMSYGNCCLVSDIPECADVVEDKAVTFNKGNGADLNKKLQQLCGNSEQVQRFKADAADFICQKYSWSDAVEKTINLYRREGNAKIWETT